MSSLVETAQLEACLFPPDLLTDDDDDLLAKTQLSAPSPLHHHSPKGVSSPSTGSSLESWEESTIEANKKQSDDERPTPSSGDMDLPSVNRTTPAGSETSPLFLLEEPEITDCPYCHKTYRQPRVLDCLHSLCEDCIIAQLDPRPDVRSPQNDLDIELDPRTSPEQKPPPGVIRCPVCKQDTRVGNDVSFVSRLLMNYVMLNLLDTKSIEKGDHKCESCKTKDSAVARCLDCSNFLCSNCVQAHTYMKCFDGHRVLAFDEIKNAYESGQGLCMHRPIFCDQHTNNPLRYYCSTCQVPVCDECLVSNHRPPEHQARHTEAPFDLALREEIGRLLKLAEKKKTACERSCNEREKLQEELNCKVDIVRESIDDMFDKFREILETRKLEMLHELDDKHSDCENQVNSTFNTIANTSQKIYDASNFANSLLTNGNTMEVLVSRKSVYQQLNQLVYSVPNPEMSVAFDFCVSEEQFRQALYTCCGELKCGVEAVEPRLNPDSDILKPDYTAMHQPQQQPYAAPLGPSPSDNVDWNSQMMILAKSVAAASEPALSNSAPYNVPSAPPAPPPMDDRFSGLANNLLKMSMMNISGDNDAPVSHGNTFQGNISIGQMSMSNAHTIPSAMPPHSFPFQPPQPPPFWGGAPGLLPISRTSSGSNTVTPPSFDSSGPQDLQRVFPSHGMSGRTSVTPLDNGPPFGNLLNGNAPMTLGGFNNFASMSSAYNSRLPPSPIGSRTPQPDHLRQTMMPTAHAMPPSSPSAVGMVHAPPGLEDGVGGLAGASVPPVRQGKMNAMQIRARFGSLGPNDGQFNSPHGFCLGFNEEVVVADTNNHRIQVFAKSGEFLHQFGVPGKDEGQLWYPRKVAIIRNELQYIVCDRGNERSRMQIFSREGLFVKKIAIRYIDIVAGLAVDSDGSIVAVDSVSPTVFRISQAGELIRWFDCSEYMKEPSDVAVSEKEYFICDFKGHCVCVFNEQGQFVRKIGCMDITCFPNGIDTSDAGDVLIGDSHGNKFHVAVFKRTGEFQTEFDCPYVKVSRCCGLRITSEGYIVTLAKNNHHVLVLNTLYVE